TEEPRHLVGALSRTTAARALDPRAVSVVDLDQTTLVGLGQTARHRSGPAPDGHLHELGAGRLPLRPTGPGTSAGHLELGHCHGNAAGRTGGRTSDGVRREQRPGPWIRMLPGRGARAREGTRNDDPSCHIGATPAPFGPVTCDTVGPGGP